MRRHEAFLSRLVVGITALGLATMGATLLGSARSDAAGVCGGTAADFVGTFIAHHAPPAYAPDHNDNEPLTVTFSTPDQMTSDNKAMRDGKEYASQKGSGTFAVQPLTWTENGTRTIGDKSGPYETKFKASQVNCASGTRVSSFTGTFTSAQTAIDDTESYARQE
jgi:hypothetical protein